MSAFENIVKWLRLYEMKFSGNPRVIPVSQPEMIEIKSDYAPYVYDSEGSKDQLLGIDVETSPWAEMTRQRILEIGIERLSMESQVDEERFRIEHSLNQISGYLHQRLTAEILADVTHLNVSFDWDRLAWLKRRVKWIGRRWPVKRKTVRIEGKVLYPYLKIQAPADTHRVRLLVQP